MQIGDFDYDLPPELIAQEPAEPRDASRMMVLDPKSDRIVDSRFSNFPEYLQPSDVLVLNDTRVIRARTHARLERQSGTTREVEIFFVEPAGSNAWHVLCRPGRRIRPGDRAGFGGKFQGTFQDNLGADLHVLELDFAEEVLAEFGEIPLPPYIQRSTSQTDESTYQTVFAAHPGAFAAPTAGLHFTPEILSAIRSLGVDIVKITLHVGIGTFLPVRAEDPTEHTLRPERYEVGQDAAIRLQRALAGGRRIIAVGTTTTRTLEYLMRHYGEIRAGAGYTDLYILPGFEFRIVAGLLTNFHLPKSTLLMLVSAFAGRETILTAYRHAIEQRYRFYSYGDCMFIKTKA
jgi:S-adenosylmethionine:tRNA ribosyltransferase-isomerase